MYYLWPNFYKIKVYQDNSKIKIMDINGFYYSVEITPSHHASNGHVKMPNVLFVCTDRVSLDVVQGFVRNYIFKQFSHSQLHTTHFKIHQEEPNKYHYGEFGKRYDNENTMPYFSFDIQEVNQDEFKARLKSKNHLIRMIDIHFIAMMVAHKKKDHTVITAFIHPNFHFMKDGVFVSRIDTTFAHDCSGTATNTKTIANDGPQAEVQAVCEVLYSTTGKESFPSDNSISIFGLNEFDQAQRSMLDFPIEIGEQLVRSIDEICVNLAKAS